MCSGVRSRAIYLLNGGDVLTLQQILGHTTLEMVWRYVNLANAHVMTQHKRFSPVDRMNLRQDNRAVVLRMPERPNDALGGSVNPPCRGCTAGHATAAPTAPTSTPRLVLRWDGGGTHNSAIGRVRL